MAKKKEDKMVDKKFEIKNAKTEYKYGTAALLVDGDISGNEYGDIILNIDDSELYLDKEGLFDLIELIAQYKAHIG